MREKMIQIYELMADITIANLNKSKEQEAIIDEKNIQMVSATLQLYYAIGDNNQPELFSKEEKKDQEIHGNSTPKETIQKILKEEVESTKNRDGHDKQIDESSLAKKIDDALEMALCRARIEQLKAEMIPFGLLI